jgi:hypothetical protein
MKRLIILLSMAFAGACVNAEQGSVSSLSGESSTTLAASSPDAWLKKIVTKEGSAYHDCRLLKVDPSGILIEHNPQKGALALTKIKFSVLPPEIQKRFNYDPSDAAQFEGLQAQSNAQWAQQIRQQQELTTELERQDQREADALRLAEEKVRLENERLALTMEHEVKLVREEAYGMKEAARLRSPDFIVFPSNHGFRKRSEESRHAVPLSTKHLYGTKSSKPAFASRTIHQ